jgi:DNA-3-methyladenine glycosylase
LIAPPPLPRSFYARPTATVARELLGKLIVRRRESAPPVMVRIVEVEAYLGERDAASHARRGPTPRAAIMFGPPGHLYVYLIYGMHHCMNFVARQDQSAGAVLVRAAAPLEPVPGPAALGLARAFSGPGKLCAALGITRVHTGLDLCAARAELYVADDGVPPPRIACSPRVGVEYAGRWARRRLRFSIAGHPALSRAPALRGPRAAAPAGPPSARRPRG